MSAKRQFVIEAEGFPDLSGMMFASIEALRVLGGSGTLHEIDEQVIEAEGLSEEEQSFFMPNDESRPKVNYYLSWARTYLKRGGALENSARGVWALTEVGNEIRTVDDTQAIYKKVNDEERARARQKRLEKKSEIEIDDDEAHAQLETADWKAQLLAALKGMDPYAFERLSQRLLREAGFTKVEVRGKTGDGGIDGVGVLRMNLVSFQVYFQCKRWKGSVGSKEIRDFRGALQGRADKGLFITTGHFTSHASEEATRDGAIAIDLIDGDALCDLLKSNNLGVNTQMVEEVTVDRDWFSEL